MPEPAAAAEPAEPVVPESDDPWESVKTLAHRATATAGIERDIASVFETRSTLARRLADAYRRKDNNMAAESAQRWIQSEVKLAKLFEAYEKHVQERNELLRACVNEKGSV
jgi:hypothetical protein